MSAELQQLHGQTVEVEQYGAQTNYSEKVAPLQGDPDAIFKLGRTQNDLQIAKHIRRNARQTTARKALRVVNIPSLVATGVTVPTLGILTLAAGIGLTAPISLPALGTAALVSAGVWGVSTAAQLGLRLAARHERKVAGRLAEKASEIRGQVPERTPIFGRKTGGTVEGVADHDPSYMSALAMRMWGRREDTAEKVSLALESALALGAGEITGNAVATIDAIASATHGAHVAHAARVGHLAKTAHHAHTAHTALTGATVAAKGGLLLSHALPHVLIGMGIYKGAELGIKELREGKVKKKIRREAERFSGHVIDYAKAHPGYYGTRRAA